MRKRRRLANKMTIMVCAVLIAVSAFFYAPMNVSAEEYDIPAPSATTVASPISTSGYYGTNKNIRYSTPFNVDSFVSDSLYKVTLSGTSVLRFYTDSSSTTANTNSITVRSHIVFASHVLATVSSNSGSSSISRSFTDVVLYVMGEDLISGSVFHYFNLVDSTKVSTLYATGSLNITSCAIEALSVADADQYQQGYEAGYADGVVAGEESGYSSGYSDGYSDGQASVDTDSYYQAGESAGYESGYQAGESAGYESGFQAGADSIDTQSYYDAGYQAGYDIAYQAGYDTGYDEAYDIAYESGYNSAMDRIASWGADTSDYPLLLLDKPLISRVFSINVKSSIPTQYSDFAEWTSDLNFNPNHTYRFNVVLNPTEYNEDSADIYFLNSDIFYLNIGGIKYHISNFSGSNVNTFFVPGARMSSAFSFSWEPLLAVMGDTFESGSAYCYYDLNYQIYDMGPSGDTQNHIANQTDQLTNGYDTSSGDSANSSLSSGLNEYETAENSLFATATTGMKDFTFFDFESVPAMLTAVTFITSIMGSWFEQAGGASGVGIVLSILFSVMLVSMVLGLYRLYQSAGHRAEARQAHKESMERWKKGN